MFSNAYNFVQARIWQEKRKRIRAAAGVQRLRILQSFGEEIHALLPVIGDATPEGKQSVVDLLETTSLFSAVLGAWLNLDPSNPKWPARDRLYVTTRSDLANACAILSVCGFFPPEQIPAFVDSVDTGGWDSEVPGIESPGVPAEELPPLVWNSATTSARDKRRWREAFGEGGHDEWLSPAWRDAPESWRSCIVLDAGEAEAEACRELAKRTDEPAAGLVAVVRAPEDAAAGIGGQWSDAGWNAVRAGGRDIVRIYTALAGANLEKPLAVVVEMPVKSEPGANISKTPARRRASGLLGEMSDEQFSELLGESLI